MYAQVKNTGTSTATRSTENVRKKAIQKRISKCTTITHPGITCKFGALGVRQDRRQTVNRITLAEPRVTQRQVAGADPIKKSKNDTDKWLEIKNKIRHP